MKRILIIGLVVVLSMGVLLGHGVTTTNTDLPTSWATPGITFALSGNETHEAMIVFYTIPDEMYMFWCDLDAVIKDKGDTWDVKSVQRDVKGISKDTATYDYFMYKEIVTVYDEEGIEIPQYMADLGLEPMDASGLPRSQHIAILKAVVPALAKPVTVTRTYYGVDYDIQCFVSQSVVDMWQVGALQVGDYVIVSFITEAPGTTEINIAIVVDKVYPSW